MNTIAGHELLDLVSWLENPEIAPSAMSDMHDTIFWSQTVDFSISIPLLLFNHSAVFASEYSHKAQIRAKIFLNSNNGTVVVIFVCFMYIMLLFYVKNDF